MSQSNDSGLNVDLLQTLLRPYGVFDVAIANAHTDNQADFVELKQRVRAALANQPAPTVPATRDAIEEAAQVFEAAAAHNRSKGRTILAHSQQSRADRIRKELDGAPAHQPAQEQAEPPFAWMIHGGDMKPILTVYSAREAAEYHPRSHVPLYTRAAQQEPVAAPQQAAAPEQFCDANCVWTDHHKECTISAPGTPEAPIVADWKPCNPVCDENPDMKNANCKCDAAKTSICRQRAAQLDGGQEGSESNG